MCKCPTCADLKPCFSHQDCPECAGMCQAGYDPTEYRKATGGLVNKLAPLVEQAVADVIAQEELLLRNWWRAHPQGGDMFVVRWLDAGGWYAVLARSGSQESQAATRPSDSAQWLSCTCYQVPAMH